jgi:hypothetical protein
MGPRGCQSVEGEREREGSSVSRAQARGWPVAEGAPEAEKEEVDVQNAEELDGQNERQAPCLLGLEGTATMAAWERQNVAPCRCWCITPRSGGGMRTARAQLAQQTVLWRRSTQAATYGAQAPCNKELNTSARLKRPERRDIFQNHENCTVLRSTCASQAGRMRRSRRRTAAAPQKLVRKLMRNFTRKGVKRAPAKGAWPAAGSNGQGWYNHQGMNTQGRNTAAPGGMRRVLSASSDNDAEGLASCAASAAIEGA